MKEMVLNGEKISSTIYIKAGNLDRTGYLCLTSNKNLLEGQRIRPYPSKLLIITDSQVAPLYLDRVKKSFNNTNVQIISHVISAGEKYKTLSTVSEIFELLAIKEFDRNDMIVSLGGGVVGDIAGFVASVYLRGMKWLVQVPTTLLAQVDSAVGGKNGIDLPQGKNLVGAIRQPDIVIIDYKVLYTLERKDFASGIAEIIKYGCIWDASILEQLEKNNITIFDQRISDVEELERVIRKCIDIKIKIVEADETENGLRKVLNFGHTVGHAIEKVSDYKSFTHGEAVAMGMVVAAKIGEQMSLTKKGSAEKLIKLLSSYNLPTETTLPTGLIYSAMKSDKKKQGDNISYILIEDLGKAKIVDIPLQELKKQIERAKTNFICIK